MRLNSSTSADSAASVNELKPLNIALMALVGTIGGFGGAAIWNLSGLGDQATRDYILANPEVLPEAMQRLQDREVGERVARLGDDLTAPYPGAVLGNPDGSITLVEFSDYACGFCRTSASDVEALIAANPDLKVVIREYPVLSRESADAARMALAAADQGKFAAFHKAMYAKERPTAETIDMAAREAEMDIDKADGDIRSGKYEGELMRNHSMAGDLGVDGTPAWVIGNRRIAGAVGEKALAEAIAEAREG
jgi:protein-disulfide isomerase